MTLGRWTLALTLAVAATCQLGAQDSSVGFDLVVSDARGRTVANLEPSDIVIHEDGVARSVSAVEPGSPRSSRVFGLFLDEYHVEPRATARVRTAVRRFIESELADGDQAVILKPLDSLVAIQLSGARAQLLDAVESFEGRLGDFTPRGPFEAQFLARSPSVVAATRARVSWSAIAALTEALGRAGDGRKTLIVVSDGIDATSVGRDGRRPGRRFVERLANRGNVAVYALDPSEAGEPDGAAGTSSEGALASLAADTGGLARRGSLESGLEAAVADARSYYWVSYDVSHDGDGRFHRVSVSVKRSDASVRARPGYWARSAALERLIAEAAEPPEPLPLAEPTHSSPLITPWFGFSRGPNGTTRVTFVWEPADRVPRSHEQLPEPTRLVLQALGPDGATVFDGAVLPSEPANQAIGGGLARAVFDAPPGRLNLRMSVMGPSGSDEIDQDVRSIVVRPIEGAVAMGSAEILRSSTARAWRRLTDDPDAAPAASRVFRRTERLLVRVPVYARGPIEATARLLGPDDRPLRTLDVERGPGEEPVFQVDLPLASLAQGAYALDISAKAPSGEARDVVRFRVTY